MSAPDTPLGEWLSSDDIEPSKLRAKIEALNDEELCHYGLRSYRMNLMALMGDRWDRERIFRSARDAAISKLWLGWLYHQYDLPRLGTEAPPARVADFPMSTLVDIQAKGQGVVVVTFHLGHMRQLPSDIAHAGIDVMVPLAADAFGNYETARLSNPQAALWKHFRHLCVEAPGGSLALARGLARGGCVLSTIDGNTGMDGPRGDDRRSVVRMLDTQVRVKNGLIAMAARFGAAILPVVAVTIDGQPRCLSLPVIDPGAPLAGEAAAAFVDQAAAKVYAWFGDVLLEYAGEWCGGDLFHQWRLPRQQSERALVEVERELQGVLERGDALAIDASRMMELAGSDERVLVDVHTTRCYRFASSDHELVQRLSSRDGGIDKAWLDGRSGADREHAWRLLCALASRDVVVPSMH